MRNKLLIIAIVICSFLFIDKVSAITEEKTTQYVFEPLSVEFINNLDYVVSNSSQDSEYINQMYQNTVKNVTKVYPYYFSTILLSSTGGNEYAEITFYAFKEKANINFAYYRYSTGSLWYEYINNSPNSLEYFTVKFYFGVPGTTKAVEKDISDGNVRNVNSKKSLLSSFFSYEPFNGVYSNKHFEYLLDSNLDIFKSNYTVARTGTHVDLKIGNYYYQNGDIIPSYKETLKPKTPNIDVNIENTKFDDDNNVIQKKLIVDYGIYDFDKYRYEYTSNKISEKNNSDGKFWLPYVNSKPLEIMVNNNDIYFFRVLDKNTNDYVTGTSVTINGINEIIPYIVFENLSDDECILKYENVNYHVCDLIKVYAKNIDYGNYELQYSYDLENWYEHTGIDNYKLYIRDNTSISFRIINLSNNEIVDTMSYTVTHLTFPNSNKPIIKFYIECLDNVVGASLKVNLYNWYSEKYKIFYRLGNESEFIETNVIQDGNNFYRYFTLTEKTFLAIKITDLEGNYLVGSSFTYSGNSCKKEEFNINNIDDVTDYVLNEESSSNELFAQILDVSYNSAPKRLVIFVKIFLILTLVGAVLYLVGWK